MFQIGCCQIMALIPGISRSGATILGGELLGVGRHAATLFTFYLAVPTMLGATVFELYKKGGALSQAQSADIAIGFIVSFVVAWFVIRSFLAIVTRYGLKPFGYYRIAAALALMLYLAMH
jgi:undecaprenyl-diphosphatase